MITKYIKGSILDTELKNFAHGVNCQGVMGAGVAKAIYTKYSAVKEDYLDYCNAENPKDLLGKIHFIDLYDKKCYNLFTQLTYGNDGKRQVNYAAIAKCFLQLDFIVKGRLAIPKIGAGLAGGDWKVIEQIINDATPNLEIWVYEV